LLISNLLQSQEVTPSSSHSIMRWLLESANKLTTADAQLVEQAFGSKLNVLPGDEERATESTVLNSARSDAAGLSATAI
jgi:hypothetical protein